MSISCSLAQDSISGVFENGISYMRIENYPTAIEILSKVLKENPDHGYFRKGYYNLGKAYFLNKNYDSASVILNSVLIRKFSDNHKQDEQYISDSYYKSLACYNLFELYLEIKQFDSAFYFLDLKYGENLYLGSCGTGYSYLRKDLDQARVLIAMGNYTEAKKLIFNTLFRLDEILPSEGVEILKSLYIKEGKYRNLKKALDKSSKKVYMRPTDKGYNNYYFKFQKLEIYLGSIPCLDLESKECREEFVQSIKRSEFYIMIDELSRMQ